MSLSNSFKSAALGEIQNSSSPDISIFQREYIQIPLYDCVKGFAADHPYAFANEYIVPQPYNYGVNVEFEKDKMSEFLEAPDFRANYHAIKGTISEMMGETLALEMVRDMNEFDAHGADMSQSEYSQLMKDIHENTFMDAEAVLADLPSILQQTFPDSGIIGAKLDYMKGMDFMCSSPASPHASLDSPAEDFSVGMAGSAPAPLAFNR